MGQLGANIDEFFTQHYSKKKDQEDKTRIQEQRDQRQAVIIAEQKRKELQDVDASYAAGLKAAAQAKAPAGTNTIDPVASLNSFATNNSVAPLVTPTNLAAASTKLSKDYLGL